MSTSPTASKTERHVITGGPDHDHLIEAIGYNWDHEARRNTQFHTNLAGGELSVLVYAIQPVGVANDEPSAEYTIIGMVGNRQVTGTYNTQNRSGTLFVEVVPELIAA